MYNSENIPFKWKRGAFLFLYRFRREPNRARHSIRQRCDDFNSGRGRTQWTRASWPTGAFRRRNLLKIIAFWIGRHSRRQVIIAFRHFVGDAALFTISSPRWNSRLLIFFREGTYKLVAPAGLIAVLKFLSSRVFLRGEFSACPSGQSVRYV